MLETEMQCQDDRGGCYIRIEKLRDIKAYLSQTNKQLDVEAVARAIIDELKKQNLLQEKGVGATKTRILIGIDEGIGDAIALAKAAMSVMPVSYVQNESKNERSSESCPADEHS